MVIQFIRTADSAQVLCFIQDHNGFSRYLITPAMPGDRTITCENINGRLYHVDTVGIAFANAFERNGIFEGIETIKPEMVAAVISTHSKRF